MAFELHSRSGLHMHDAPGTSPITRSKIGFSRHTAVTLHFLRYGVSMSMRAVGSFCSDPSINLHTLKLPVICFLETKFLFTHIELQPLSSYYIHSMISNYALTGLQTCAISPFSNGTFCSV